MKDPLKFKELYKFLFEYSVEPGFKNIPIEIAFALWSMLLSDKCNFINKFIEFLQKEKADLLVI